MQGSIATRSLAEVYLRPRGNSPKRPREDGGTWPSRSSLSLQTLLASPAILTGSSA